MFTNTEIHQPPSKEINLPASNGEDLTTTNQSEQHTRCEIGHRGEPSLIHNHRPQAIMENRKMTEKMESSL
ncbi:unnamed protein product [Arabidopsis lyrata]|uniref:Predicted protein n=1 Tax=Arabidopsis lyrata subsp. lyrata TaxID=81972 RepID=D7MTC1_ARALL|nr:predicted protein [Arabidopsis lyrata subsp. lyrata]CAH8278164.1 unnamed protein product [Arabidopsis lyrata]